MSKKYNPKKEKDVYKAYLTLNGRIFKEVELTKDAVNRLVNGA